MIQKYMPYIYFDKKEPFKPRHIGYTIFKNTEKSKSFNRIIEIKDEVKCVIEYAIYWNFDIGHLYELEHVWVYLNEAGDVVNAEASFHGRYFKVLLTDNSNLEDETHISVYSQPGKHAFMPKTEYFYLLPDLYEVTYDKAGIDGLTVPDMFLDRCQSNEAINNMVRSYMQRYKFNPSMEFERHIWRDEVITTWDELSDEIPTYIKEVLKEIEEDI